MGIQTFGRGRRLAGSVARGRVLIAEDMAVVRESLRHAVEHLGWSADAVANGTDAVSLATSREYELILLDLQLPLLTGTEVAERIGEELPSWRRPILVAISAEVDGAEMARCRDVGFDHFVSKPIRLSDLAMLLGSGQLEEGEGVARGSLSSRVAQEFEEPGAISPVVGKSEYLAHRGATRLG